MEDYDEIVAKQSKRKLTATEIQRARYGLHLDQQWHQTRQVFATYAKYLTAAATLGAALATIWRAYHGG